VDGRAWEKKTREKENKKRKVRENEEKREIDTREYLLFTQ
jgi:hypothetical protein